MVHPGRSDERHPLRHSEKFKHNNWGRDSTIRNGPKVHSNEKESSEVKPKQNINKHSTFECRNTDLDASWPNKGIDLSLVNTAATALIDLEQPEGSIFTTTDLKGVESISVPAATESNIGEIAPTIHITLLDHEPLPLPQASIYHIPRKNSSPCMPSNLVHSFDMFVHKENDGCEVKSRRTQSVLKVKTCTEMPQDFIILGKSSIQHQTNKTKNPIPRVRQSYEDARISSKFQKRKPQQDESHFDQINQKPPEQVLPCISKSSVGLGKAVTPLPVGQAQSTMDFMDLKYSDMFKEIHSSDKGPGIYEMFGTPVYSRESSGHENSCCRNVHSAPVRKLSSIKYKSNHLSEKKSGRTRGTQRKTYPKSHKNPPSTKQKHRDLMPTTASELDNNSQEAGGSIVVPSTEVEINTSRNSTPFYKDGARQLPVSPESIHSKQNEVTHHSHLGAIEEVSLENSLDAVGGDCIHRIFVTSIQELLWPQVKDHARYAPFLGIARETNDNKSLECVKYLNHGSTGAPACLMDQEASQDLCSEENPEAPFTFPLPEGVPSSPERCLQNGKINLASRELTCHSTNPFRQTSQNTLSCTTSEEITEDFCCLATESLSLDGADACSSRAFMENENGEAQMGYTGNKEATTSDVNNEDCCPTVLKSSMENRLFNEVIFSESSLVHEVTIMWTKGEILGKGAYGTVYCGLTSQGQLIAVKQVVLGPCDQAGTEKEYQKLQEEVEILKTLEHINIVEYLGTGLKDNIVSIFMEFVPGGSISSIIHRFGPLPEIVFCKYTRQILHGVAYLHDNHVVHRDIKGNNVMLMPNGVIKLIDFGCAKRLACVSLTDSHSEPLKSIHGTPYWMAPEVINESGYGRKSDIWSIGCTVFEMATGKPPLASMDKIAAMFYIGAHRGLMPSIPSHCSRKAADFVHVCLTRNQHERPTALQLLQHPFVKGSP